MNMMVIIMIIIISSDILFYWEHRCKVLDTHFKWHGLLDDKTKEIGGSPALIL